KVPLQVFDIVQFSRSCAALSLDRRPIYFTTSVFACQALFSFLLDAAWQLCGGIVRRGNYFITSCIKLQGEFTFFLKKSSIQQFFTHQLQNFPFSP
ncbi:hypothetical protein, partial [Faecalibacterium sp. An58]|uniref:hypothetical protein n=1 Tax=Faecalibacterium sp. An58 TaxID=1965648 RepID=UPI00194FB980